ncbi:MAG: hypothetical protein QXR30_00745 [Candidatus Woesearchaeota archaeon]
MKLYKSKVRDRIIQILSELGESYGYDVAKKYAERFGKESQRLIYYHLEKGVQLGLFERIEKEEEGEFSWGNKVTKVYYRLKQQ